MIMESVWGLEERILESVRQRFSPEPFLILTGDPAELRRVICFSVRIMPKVKTNRVKYPEGWELIEPTLRELQGKMREAENDPHDGKRKCETLWPIFKIAHQKSRYIFDLYHRRKEISKELYEFCLDQGYADCNLIAKWKKVHATPRSQLPNNMCLSSPQASEGGKGYRVRALWLQGLCKWRLMGLLLSVKEILSLSSFYSWHRYVMRQLVFKLCERSETFSQNWADLELDHAMKAAKGALQIQVAGGTLTEADVAEGEAGSKIEEINSSHTWHVEIFITVRNPLIQIWYTSSCFAWSNTTKIATMVGLDIITNISWSR
ncbi:unnamed protein product [Camellia sinensis]